ncbi:2-amino-4-hydroxy-6-hydroxymethyldihydropteridine pyrophosphokinase [Anatilimnocola aggregata]|uniref:2-amino-4-hydroxy-6-hydroxymethyldihydropteridine pyrophosphokinase n=1 Tax=Anatilimnocola aggregata TaxID=2528021 RepID=A0A517YHX0_9BACT|nr:2-amino-4-hydroxy-6-hydroxymethyldihydropteridine diphosphokinase [Anatilimnocola aggregata]QDU29818.1 2-amino-4-hydroxy-6-hydroxymethyldihydropteridine pyrophosphokinase [Anatilimnocola aggregata]
MASCLIGLGSNLGDRVALLRSAIGQLSAVPEITALRVSSFHGTAAAGCPQSQSEYLNAVATFVTSLSPQQLLAELQRIEIELGRERSERWGPRTIDLDLLLYDQLEVETTALTLPHPRMSFRRFVLEPAAEIAGSMVHPICGWTIEKLLAHIKHSPRRIDLAPAQTRFCDDDSSRLLLAALGNQPHIIRQFRLPIDATTRAGESTASQSQPPQSWLITNQWVVQDLGEPLLLEPLASNERLDCLRRMREGKNPFPALAIVWQPAPTAVLFAFNELRRLPDAGPVLWIPGVPLEQAVQEVYAAMTAMG